MGQYDASNHSGVPRQVLHIQEFLNQAPRAPICAKALHRRAMARRVSNGLGKSALSETEPLSMYANAAHVLILHANGVNQLHMSFPARQCHAVRAWDTGARQWRTCSRRWRWCPATRS